MNEIGINRMSGVETKSHPQVSAIQVACGVDQYVSNIKQKKLIARQVRCRRRICNQKTWLCLVLSTVTSTSGFTSSNPVPA